VVVGFGVANLACGLGISLPSRPHRVDLACDLKISAPSAILAGDDTEAVMLDFVQPQPARRQRIGRCGKARLDKAGR
jgi:hypothetical protein